MFVYIRNRILLAIPTLLLVSFITFILGYFAPASPVDVIMGQHGDPAIRHQVEHAYGLDRPAMAQFGSFVWNALHGDLGRSFFNSGRPVKQMVAEEFPVTASLACMALLTALVVGLPMGVVAALKHNKLLDRAAMLLVLLMVSVPAFVLGPIMVLVLSQRLEWLPAIGWDGPANYVMPVLVLAARPTALFARFMRASMLEVLQQDYIRTAIAKGLSPAQVLIKHALKNAFLPVLTAIGNNFGYLLTGSFVVETIFGVPGIGLESVQSILNRDYPVIQGVALLVAGIFITVNLIVDILYHLVDPRLRYEEGA